MDREWKPQHKEHQTYTPPAKASKGPNRMVTRDETGRKIRPAPADDDPRFDDSKPSRKQAEFEGTAPADDEPSQQGASGEGFSFRNVKPLYWKIAGGALVLLLILFLLILPGIKGYHVYKAMKASGVPDTYLTDMTGLQKAKDNAEQSLASTKSKLDTCQSESEDQVSRSQSDISNLNRAVEACAQDAAAAKDDAQACEDAQSEQESVIQNAANRLCCIARVENSAINAYAILDDKITCVSEGGTEISC